MEQLMGLTLKQKRCLVSLAYMERKQVVSLKALAARLNMTLPAASVLVDSLVKMDLLQRQISMQDRRAVCIQLSPRGKNLFQNICCDMKAATDSLWEGIPEDKLMIFADVVACLHQKLYTDS